MPALRSACTLTALLAAATLFAPFAVAHPADEEAAEITRLLRLRPGMSAADVGAGDGEWGETMARVLGSTGRMFLTEIDEDELHKLRDRVEESDLETMSVVAGKAEETGLPDACCDAILLRLVYHHMSDRAAMRDSLRHSLRPDGLLLIIEMDRDGHGFDAESLVEEMTADGFELVSRHPDWGAHSYQYAVVFRPATAGAEAGT
jgi:ubiquinone/menaquinone biosynthesis C-methylase UbiE